MRVILHAVGAMMLLSACGGGDTTGGPTRPPTEASSPSTAGTLPPTDAPTTSTTEALVTIDQTPDTPAEFFEDLIDVFDGDDSPDGDLSEVDPNTVLVPFDPGPADAVFRFWTYLGPDTPGAPSDFDISLTPGGRVVLVEGTSVFHGAEVYTTWQLSGEGARRLTDYVLTHPLVLAGESLGSNDRAYALDIVGARLDAHPDTGSVDAAVAGQLVELAQRLRDQSWLRDEIISGPEPWIPDEMTMLATSGRSGSSGGPSPYEWPLVTPIEELGMPIDWRGEQRLALCLSGEDAAAAWTLVRSGENHAYIPVTDGDDWTLSYQIRFPGYALYRDPCVER